MQENNDIVILMPVFNDWPSLRLLLPALEEALIAYDLRASLFIVDDGSLEEMPQAEFLKAAGQGPIQRFEIIRLGTNLGHQRAIAIGLCYIKENVPCAHVIVMDSDGQDSPRDVPVLLKKCKEEKDRFLIFARRTKRSEARTFIFFYLCYKQLHRMFTGMTMEVGNFCVIPGRFLDKITLLSEIWNHFAAGIIKNRIPCQTVACVRAKRLTESPKMNFFKLVQHGLCAISVFADIIGIRAFLFVISIMGLTFVFIFFLIALKFATNIPITGWTSTIVVMLISLSLQLMSISLLFIFIVLFNRNSNNFLPIRDYSHYIVEAQRIF